MAEYIEREKFRENLYVDKYGNTDIVKVNIALDKSAADVAPVVRCEECNFYGRNKRCVKSGIYTVDSDFCSYGERKEGAD